MFYLIKIMTTKQNSKYVFKSGATAYISAS